MSYHQNADFKRFSASTTMHISIFLDDSKQWSWRLMGPRGSCYAIGAKVFARYADAYCAAVDSCNAMRVATIEVDERVEQPDFKVVTESNPRDASPIDAFCHDVIRALEQEGLHAALSVLNRTVPHRFTGVYLIEPDQTLRNLSLFDKAGEPCPVELQRVPLNASFCQFAVTTGGFATSNSGNDSRLQGHWAKGMYNAYAGVPILADDGTALGTLCHFDHHPKDLDYEDLDLLRLAARMFVRVVCPLGKRFDHSIK